MIEQKQGDENEEDGDDNEPPKKTTEDMMKEFFEKIKQLRNVSPEDFAKEMETFIDAQIETCDITKETLYKYKQALEEKNHPLKDDIVNYTHGARCTFKDFTCVEDCKNIEGKRLVRKI